MVDLFPWEKKDKYIKHTTDFVTKMLTSSVHLVFLLNKPKEIFYSS